MRDPLLTRPSAIRVERTSAPTIILSIRTEVTFDRSIVMTVVLIVAIIIVIVHASPRSIGIESALITAILVSIRTQVTFCETQRAECKSGKQSQHGQQTNDFKHNVLFINGLKWHQD
jgi:hypothetical protein